VDELHEILLRHRVRRHHRAPGSFQDSYRETIDPYRDCPEAEMQDAQVSVVGAVSIGSFELSR